MKLIAKSLLLLSFGTVVAYAQIPNFQHIIVIVQENRTPDNLFQGFCKTPSGGQSFCSTTPKSWQYNIQRNERLAGQELP